jgi:DNA topoisomerase I
MAKNLVIVESPGKIKKIQGYLGKDFKVVASYGHIRDLASGNKGVDKKDNFKPNYVISPDKKDVVSGLKKLAKSAETIWLAGDDDREGTAISWHVKECLNMPDEKFKRIIFTEITKKALEEAIANPVELDINLFNAQQARRVLDRLVGFDLSPLLWKKVRPNLSAGRVQSVALRIVTEKEDEIKSFVTSSDFKTEAYFSFKNKDFKGILNKRFETKNESKSFLEKCITSEYIVESIETKPGKKSSPAPFTTSTLQQAASSKFGFSLNRIMSAAQSLYEGGHITYMRTDSVMLSEDALNSIEQEITKKYGSNYSNRKSYKSKSKGAQEAHEAIRPVNIDVEYVGDSEDCRKLYNLIWKRTIASQMSDAQLEKTVITTKVTNADEKFLTKGEVITFDGFLKVYTPEEKNEEDESGVLPKLEIGNNISCSNIKSFQTFKKPPLRYSEASIVKKLEELGIGRPSTYASIISTILKREYVQIKDIESKEVDIDFLSLENSNIYEETKKENYGGEKNKFVPTEIGELVTKYLVENFDVVMDYNFTANVESEFDEIAKGNINWQDVIRNFYEPFSQKLKSVSSEKSKINQRELGTHPESNLPIFAKIGKYGPMVQLGDGEGDNKPKFAKLKEGQDFNNVTLEDAVELLKWPRVLGEINKEEISVSTGKFGPYIKYKGKFISLPEHLDVNMVTLSDVEELVNESQNEKKNNNVLKEFKSKGISVLNGKFGPYIKKGAKNYKIPEYHEPENLTLKDCEEIIKKGSKSKKKKSK